MEEDPKRRRIAEKREPEGERDGEDEKPYLAASLDQGRSRRERPSSVDAYVQLFAAEHGGDTADIDVEPEESHGAF